MVSVHAILCTTGYNVQEKADEILNKDPFPSLFPTSMKEDQQLTGLTLRVCWK